MGLPREEPAVYDIIIIGTTISFAGIPRRKASKIVPSSPRNCAKGSKKPEADSSRETPFWETFARIQIRSPAGAAAIIALFKTCRVLVKKECTSTERICGLR